MKNDPIVREVRETRRRLAKRFDFDVARIAADARAREAQSGQRVVSLADRRRMQAACNALPATALSRDAAGSARGPPP